MTQVITHRGLDPSRHTYYPESSLEAFEDHLRRGFGLEFDLQFTKDNNIVISHDAALTRISNGMDQRSFWELTGAEIADLRFNDCRIVAFDDLLERIKLADNTTICAIHLKHHCHTPERLDMILSCLQGSDPARFVLFDVTPEAASYVKSRNQAIQLAPSIAHEYDIKRYNTATGGTLIPLEEAIKHRDLFDWVWLDEWDLRGREGTTKKFYIKKIVDACRKVSFNIAFVSPELHASSPGLLGGESHPDAADEKRLIKRWQEMMKLHPDAVCTDYPDALKNLLHK